MRSWSTVVSASGTSQDRLPPEQKPLPSPVTTTARTDASSARWSIARTQEAVISSLIALRCSGRSRISRATPAAGRSSRRWVKLGSEDEFATKSDMRGTLLGLLTAVP